MRRVAALALLATLAAVELRAQPADSTGVPARPADSLAVPLEPLPPAEPVVLRDPLAPFGPAPGSLVTPVPAVTPALGLQSLLDGPVPGAAGSGRQPAVFAYALSAPGRFGGTSLDGLDPSSPTLTLDGRPLDGLVTGAPRLDLLPLAILGPLRMADGALGRTTSLHATTRDVRLGVPVTELRYLGGGVGTRHASGTHAQTRRAPAALGGEEGRLTLTGHASNRAVDGPLAGAQLRHTDAMARVLLTRPGAVVEVGGLYADRTEGARSGVVAASGRSPTALFDLATVDVRNPSATRRSIRAEAWMRTRLALASVPTEAGVSVTSQRLIYAISGDSARANGARLAAFVEQPAVLGAHRLHARLDVTSDAALEPATTAVPAGGRLGLHAMLADSLRIGPAEVAAQVGVHRVGDETWPSGALRLGLGPLSAGVRLGARAPSALRRAGLDTLIVPLAGGLERTLAVDVGVHGRVADWRFVLRAFGDETRDGHHLADQGDSLVVAVTAEGALRQLGASVEVGWRERTRRGVYGRIGGTIRQMLDPPTELAERIDAALPRAWGRVRVGVRAEDVGDVLDLDLAVVASGWTAFRSRLVEPATGVLVLPEPGAALGIDLPARGTVGASATATFSARTSLFLRYDNALAERLYDGAIVTQGEPLAPAVLRFGVFWALLN
ncbi:MAG: hypothetical protein AAGK21_16470 [Bacteroidota bacterium]